MRFIGLIVVALTLVGGVSVASEPSTSANAARAEVAVKVSPRERFFVWLVLRAQKTEGAEQDSLARVWEGLDLEEIEKTFKDGVRAKKELGEIELSFSESKASKRIARDDAGHVVKWFSGSLDNAMVIALRPLKAALSKIADGRDP